MNLPLVVYDPKAGTYTRYVNRVRHVRVKAEVPLTPVELEGFRLTPAAYANGVPPEPRAA